MQEPSCKKEIPSSHETDDSIHKKKTMSLLIKEGLFGGLSMNLTGQFITPYALHLKASPSQIGIMSSLLGVIPPLGQIAGSHLMKRKSRRSLIIKSVILQTLILPFIMLLGLFFSFSGSISILPIFLICFYVSFSFFGSITNPSFFSLMGDIIPENRRGRYFSKRNLLITTVSITISILASIYLDQLRNTNQEFIGFFIIFFIAFISRGMCIFIFRKFYYPPFTIEKSSYVKLKTFIKKMPNSNFGIFTLFITFMFFSVNIGAPFVGVYMLEVLNFSYIEYIIVSMSTPLIGILFSPLLGHISDKYGNAIILKICGFLLPTVPILWIVMNNPIHLILGPQLMSSFAWTGLNLAVGNFIYDNASPQQRGFFVAYFSLFQGMGILFGGFLGSFLLNVAPIVFISIYETLFLISGFGRLFVDFIFLFRLKEVRINNGNHK
ncbi:MAG: MFS transporter [Promethearchaeota archaeon]|jgi:MFS family permease